MNIAFFDATPKWSGGANRIFLLAKNLKSLGVGVLIICLPGSKLFERAKNCNIQVVGIRPLTDFDPISFVKVIFILVKYKIDAVDINSPKFYWIVLLAAKLLGKKIIITRNVPYRKKGIKKLINKMFLYSLCDHVISLSEKVKQELVEDFGINNVEVIYDGVVTNEKWYSLEKINALRKKWGINTNDIVFAVIGRIEKNKGHIVAIKAINEVKKLYPNIRLLIVGNVEEKSYFLKLKNLVEKYNLQDVVKFLGFVENMSEVYNIIDILLHHSVFDNIPQVILEAMCYKKPVVASRVGGIPEIVIDGVNGYLFEPSSINDMVEKIKKVLNSEFVKFGVEGCKIVK